MTSGPTNGAELPPPPAPHWDLAPAPEPEAVARLVQALSLPPPLCSVLAARRITDPDEAKRFLRPELSHLHPPEALADAPLAAARISRAIDAGETILVHGDYDVDGVCAAALLTLWIERLGGRAVPFVPHRMRDGYDLGPAGVRAARDAGATLLVTCDSGITAHEAVEAAAAAGIEVIVTDHHTCGESLPPALAVVNPARPDCDYPEATLCGTGVAFQLARLLARERGVPEEELHAHLDLVALATVADLVPLRGENRTLVRFGLRHLERTAKPGLRALLEVSGVEGPVDAGKVGFIVAPRINAVGRMGAAETALRLLLTTDPREAGDLARLLDQENTRRQDADRRTLEEALELLGSDFDAERDFGVVLAAEGWHPGVIGIVASRVVERVHRPTLMIALDGASGRGSARSIPGVHLYDALKECEHLLTRFGGHRQAAGFDIDAERVPELRRAFDEAVRRQVEGRLPPPRAGADAPLHPHEATDELHHFLEYLGPFGIGNPRPVFWVKGIALAGAPRVVGGGHLKLRFRHEGRELDAIGFSLADRVPPALLSGRRVDALFQLRDNEYRGVRSLQARLVDVRPSEEAG